MGLGACALVCCLFSPSSSPSATLLLRFASQPPSSSSFAIFNQSSSSSTICRPSCTTTSSTNPKSFGGCRIGEPYVLKQRRALVAKASSNVQPAGSDGPLPPSDDSEVEEESVPVENLPLESKLQLKLEQKLRMKLAKKIRLRRKKLLRKRRLRKKGRWPPSKLKKNKNV